MGEKKDTEERYHGEEGEITVHRQITESYQSGVIDRLQAPSEREKSEKEK